MLLIPPPLYRPRRRIKSGAASSSPGTSLTVVAVRDVVLDGDSVRMTLVFDTTQAAPLLDVSAAEPAKWNVRYQGIHFMGYSLNRLNYRSIRLTTSEAEASPGANELNYSNAPSDIADTLGRQLAAFTGRPLV